MTYFLASSGSDLAKIIVMGLAAAILPFIIASFTNRKTSKREREKNKLNNQLRKVNLKISELGVMKNNGVLEEDEYNQKLKSFEKEKLDINVEYYLKQNKKYIMLKRAYDKDFINESQFNIKLDEIKSEI